MFFNTRYVLAVALLSSMVLGESAKAEYPDRTIHLITPFGEGQTTITGRFLVNKLQEVLRVPVVLEQKPGAGGMSGTEYVVRQPADGYTLVWGVTSSLTQPFAKHRSYDPLKDLAPVAFTLESAAPVVLVRADSSLRSVEELKARSKIYWSANNRTLAYLAGLQFIELAKVDARYIMANAESEVIRQLLASEVDFGIVLGPSIVGRIGPNGDLRALVQLSNVSSEFLIGVPTVVRAGISGFVELPVYSSIMVPAATPAPIIEKLTNAIRKVQGDPEFVAHLRTFASVPLVGGPKEVKKWLETTTKNVDQLIVRYKIERE